MESMKRALRRHHAKRLKKNRKQHWGMPLEPKALGRVLNTATPCSCWMCGNPRRRFGTKSLQERRYAAYARLEA